MAGCLPDFIVVREARAQRLRGSLIDALDEGPLRQVLELRARIKREKGDVDAPLTFDAKRRAANDRD